jgi:hypothetical protein
VLNFYTSFRRNDMKKIFLFMSALIVFSSTSYGVDINLAPPPYSYQLSTFEVCFKVIASEHQETLRYTAFPSENMSYLNVLPLCRTLAGEDLLDVVQRMVGIPNAWKHSFEISIIQDGNRKLSSTRYKLCEYEDGAYFFIRISLLSANKKLIGKPI